MTDLNIKLVAFQDNGDPLRAEVQCTLKEQSFSTDPVVGTVTRLVDVGQELRPQGDRHRLPRRTRRSSGRSSDARRPDAPATACCPSALEPDAAGAWHPAIPARPAPAAGSRRRRRTSTPSSPARRSSCSPSATSARASAWWLIADANPAVFPLDLEPGTRPRDPDRRRRPAASSARGRSDGASPVPQVKFDGTARSTRSSGSVDGRGQRPARRRGDAHASRTRTARAPISSRADKTLTVELGWDDGARRPLRGPRRRPPPGRRGGRRSARSRSSRATCRTG